MYRASDPAAMRVDVSKLDVNSMLLFHEVFTCGSINQAASRLKISKASISRKLTI
jgi:hypothetical protein